MLRALDPLFIACLRDGTSRLHGDRCVRARVRLRRDGVLDSRRLSLGDSPAALRALDAAWTAALSDDWDAGRESPPTAGSPDTGPTCRDLVCSVGPTNVLARISAERAVGPSCASVVFEVSHWTPHAPTLEELIDDGAAASRLRGFLAERSGLIVVLGTDESALAVLGDAIAQGCAAPDRKVARGASTLRHTIAGLVQLDLGPGRAADPRRLMQQDADVIVFDESPERAERVAITERACGRALIVRTLACTHTVDALRRLCAEGADARWLAWQLRAVVRLDRLRTLCTECRQPMSSEALTLGAITSPTLTTPLSLALAGSLQRYCEAPGCARCEWTGIERSSGRLTFSASATASPRR